LLGLFAYHRDAPLVARALGLSLEELDAELQALGIRAKAHRLARGRDADLPRAAAVPGPSGPPVRRRSKKATPSPEPASVPSPPETEAALLKRVLAEVGPRRPALATRLGATGAALLARFRAAGLEREFALRERDLVRALWALHHASESKVAHELNLSETELRAIVSERGLARELGQVRDRFRRDVLRRKWPKERILEVLNRREALTDLGLLPELEREVVVRAGVIWKSLSGRRDALDLFAQKLRLTRGDAQRLSKLLADS
jgi:hypothetical protein